MRSLPIRINRVSVVMIPVTDSERVEILMVRTSVRILEVRPDRR